MGVYIKKFRTRNEYDYYMSGEPILPNVSKCDDENVITHYNPKINWNWDTFYYKTVDGEVLDKFFENIDFMLDENGNPVELISNTYENGIGAAKYAGEIRTIESWAFDCCTNLLEITLPDSVEHLNCQSIGNMENLTAVTFGAGLTDWDRPLENTPSLVKIDISPYNPNYKTIGDCNGIFSREDNSLVIACRNTSIPRSTTIIGSHAYYGCYGLTDIVIPDWITEIESHAFDECRDLTACTLSKNLETIGFMAFSYTGIEDIIIPKSVTFLEAECLEAVHGTITMLPTTPPGYSISSWGRYEYGPFPDYGDFIIYVPAESLEAYKTEYAMYIDHIQPIS